MIRTIEELKYLMAFYNIKRLPLFENNTFLGYVTKDLQYDSSRALRYFSYKKDAIDYACENIDSFINELKKLKSKEVIKIELIEVTYDNEKSVILEGTIDSIFESFEKANNKFRYCNGHYWKLKEKSYSHLYSIWTKIIDDMRSFHLYYGNGIVD